MIGLGCMRLSTAPERDEMRARAVIDAAVAAGVELFDTADAYCHDDGDTGANESLLAPLATTHRIVTKGGLTRPGGAWIPNGRARHLAAAARASRDRLGAIGLYLLHVIDPKVPLATSVRALVKLRDEGVIAEIGLSNVTPTQLDQALAIAPIAAIEVELHPWNLDAVRGGLLARCAERGIELFAHRPLGGTAGVKRAARDPVLRAIAERLSQPGSLELAPGARKRQPELDRGGGRTRQPELERAHAGDPQPELERAHAGHPQPELERAHAGHPQPELERAHAGELAVTPVEIVLAWLRSLSPAITPLPGATRVETVQSAVRGQRLILDDDARAQLASHFLDVARTHAAPASRAGGKASGKAGGEPGETGGETGETVGETGGEIVVILGMPAAGKSTLAESYVTRGYLRLNRDDRGGSLLDLARALDEHLAEHPGTSAVLDNTYPTRASRAPVIEVARRHGLAVRCVVVATTLEQAQAHAAWRVLERCGSFDGPAVAKEIRPGVQFRYRRDFEPPALDEGFIEIEELAPPRHEHGRHAGLIVELDGVVWLGRPQRADKIELRPGVREAIATWSGPIGATVWRPGLAVDAIKPPGATMWRPGGSGEVIEAMTARLGELLGRAIDVRACPHPAGPPVCWCRKPLPGLAIALARDLDLDLARSVHVGSGHADKGFALRAGMRYATIEDGWPRA